MRNFNAPEIHLKPIQYQQIRLFYLLGFGGIVEIIQVLQWFCDSLAIPQIGLATTPLQLSRNALGLMSFSLFWQNRQYYQGPVALFDLPIFHP